MRDGVGDGIGAVSEGGHLEDAHGAIPDDGAGVGDLVGEQLDRGGADVEGHKVGGEGVSAGEDGRGGVCGELIGEDVIGGKEEADAL